MSLPTKIRQNTALARSQDIVKEETFKFLPPRSLPKLELFQTKTAQLETKNSLAEQPTKTRRGSAFELPAEAFHLASSTATRHSNSLQPSMPTFVIGIVVLLSICMGLYALWPEELEEMEKSKKNNTAQPPKANDALLAGEYCDGKFAQTYQNSEGKSKQDPDPEPSGYQPPSFGAAHSRDALLAMEHCDGTWARSYQSSDGNSKQALELLFRCHIIPPEEFARSRVGQEQIDECVWIATCMLNQKPLEQWLQQCGEAQQTFEENVVTCAQNAAPKQTSHHAAMPVSEEAPQIAQAPENLDETQTSQPENLDETQTSEVRSPFTMPAQQDLGAMSASSGHSSPLSRNSKPTSPATLLRTPEDSESLLTRCRQIMSSSDEDRKQWSSMPAMPVMPVAADHDQTPPAMEKSRSRSPSKQNSPSKQDAEAETKEVHHGYSSAKF